jgi:hypothetical protein
MIDGMRAKPSKKMDNIGPMPIFVKLEKWVNQLILMSPFDLP